MGWEEVDKGWVGSRWIGGGVGGGGQDTYTVLRFMYS